MKAFVPGKPYWWQWFTVLSLDAPAVALAWQWLLANVAGDPLQPHHAFILGAAVWLTYVADRWIEGWRLDPDQVRTQRHLFYQRYRWPVFGAGIAVMLASVGTAWVCLDPREFRAGFLLLIPVLIYLLSHQHFHREHPWRVPKEICVAILFAIGVSCFTLVRNFDSLASIGVPLALFSLLCLANLTLISIWEYEVDVTHGQVPSDLKNPAGRRLVQVLPWLIAALAGAFAWRNAGLIRTADLCAAASGVLLGIVNRFHAAWGRQLARVLADIVLLTPVVPWFWIEMLRR